MISEKQVQRLYDQSYVSYIATYFAAVLAYWLFKDIAPERIINTWFIIFSLFTAARFILTWRYKQNKNKEHYDIWFILFLIATAISGTLWGLTGFLFIPDDTLSLLDSVLDHGILLLFIASLIGGSIITYSASKMVYMSFSIPAIVPQCLMLIAQGNKYHSFLGGIVLAYACIMFVISVYINRVFTEYNKIETENEFLKKIITSSGIKIKQKEDLE